MLSGTAERREPKATVLEDPEHHGTPLGFIRGNRTQSAPLSSATPLPYVILDRVPDFDTQQPAMVINKQNCCR